MKRRPYAPVPTKCPLSFDGTLQEFLNQFGSKLSLKEDSFKAGHTNIVNTLNSKPLLIVRAFKEHNRAGENYFSTDTRAPFVVGDNEPVVWFWLQHFQNPEFNKSLHEIIDTQSITISMAPSRGEKSKNWKTWGSGESGPKHSQWRGYQGGRWKLCHIFQAAPNHLGNTEEDLRARFVRNFHPLNHFWFVSEYSWKTKGRFDMSPARLGESKPICLGHWNHHSSMFPDQSEWFKKIAKVTEEELFKVPEDLSEVRFRFQWEPTDQAVSEPEVCAGSLLSTMQESPNSSANLPTFVVCENSKGRYHFNKFGVQIAGTNRDSTFEISVRNSDDQEIARSYPTTAKELEIAEDGIEDYMRNHYRQSDFMIANEDGDVTPNSPIARRVHWRS